MKLLFVRQKSDWDCGLSCLAMVHYYFFQKQNVASEFFYNNQYSQNLNLLQLEQIAQNYQLKLTSFATTWKHFQTLPWTNPVMLPVTQKGENHFLIVVKKRWKYYLVGDPLQEDWQWWSATKLAAKFKNIIVLTAANRPIDNQDFRTKKYFHFINKSWALVWVFGLLNIVLVTLLILFNQLLIKNIIQKIVTNHQLQLELTLGAGVILLFISRILIEILTQIQINFWSKRYFQQNRAYFWQVLTKISFLKFEKYQPTSIWQKYHYLQIFNHYYTNDLLSLLKSVFVTLISFSILIIFDLWMTIPVLFLTCCNFLLNFLIWPKQNRLLKQRQINEQQLNTKLILCLQNWQDWKKRHLLSQALKPLLTEDQINLKMEARQRKYSLISQISFKKFTFLKSIGCLIFLQLLKTRSFKMGNLLFIFTLTMNVLQESQLFCDHWWKYQKLKLLKQELVPFLNCNLSNQSHNLPTNSLTLFNSKIVIQI